MEHKAKDGGGDAAAEGPGVYSGVGGHATPSKDDAALPRTPEQDKEHEAGLMRLGMNNREVGQHLG